MSENTAAKSSPKISIISPSFNTGKFLEETIRSVQAQSYKNIEHIIVDGVSTDGSVEILKKHLEVKWISEKDRGFWEAFERGLNMATGDYIMPCCISDGYVDPDWFKHCVEVMENDREIGFVWGFVQNITEDGKNLDVIFKQFHEKNPPQKFDYFYYWLRTFDAWQESNVCFRASAWRDCFPKFDIEKVHDVDPILEVKFQSQYKGYLAYFVRAIGSFGRQHAGHLGEREQKNGDITRKARTYWAENKGYRRAVLSGSEKHFSRDADGNILPVTFSRWKYYKEYVLAPRSMIRSALVGGANLVRRPINAFMYSRLCPSWLSDQILHLKYFYERKGW